MSIDRASGKKSSEPAKNDDEENNQEKSGNKSDKEIKKKPQMKTVKPSMGLATSAENDGSILIAKKGSTRNLMIPQLRLTSGEFDIDDDSSSDEQESIVRNLESKFQAEAESYNTEEQKRKQAEEKRNRRETMARDIKKEGSQGSKKDLSRLFEKNPKSPKSPLSIQKSSSRRAALSTSPRLTVRKDDSETPSENSSATIPASPRSRLSNAPKFIRDISQRLSWVSGDDASDAISATPHTVMTTEMTNELVGAHWDFFARQGLPDFSKIPEKVLNELADLSYKIRNNENYKSKSSEDQHVYMRRELGRRLIGSLVANAGEDFDNAVLGSTKKMRSYLKETYGILIAAPSEKRKSMIVSDGNSSNSGKSQGNDLDFLDHLQKNVEGRMNNYQIDLVFDLKNSPDGDFIQKAIAKQFVSNFGTDTSDVANAKRSDVSKNFLRDFPNSTYLFEDLNGVQKKISTIDEFISLIGDPEKKGLPYLVSHFSNQNLPVFLRNLFFGRTSEDGSPVSVLRLHDGTPMNIAISPNSTYIFRKAPDGGITLKYEGKIDTTGSAKLGRNAAYLLKKEWVEEKQKDEIVRTPVVIEGATATWSQEVTFKANGLWELKNPRIQAKGWNRVTV